MTPAKKQTRRAIRDQWTQSVFVPAMIDGVPTKITNLSYRLGARTLDEGATCVLETPHVLGPALKENAENVLSLVGGIQQSPNNDGLSGAETYV